jgi:hypothetical protein
VKAVLFQPRWGSGYSGGDGGQYRVSIQTDDGTRRHHPSGRRLASLTWRPGNRLNNGYVRRFVFPRPPRLQKGRIYHLVFKNLDPQPSRNYVSINELFTFERLHPRQPRFADGIYAVINGSSAYGSGDSWSVDPRHTANMDIVYANGRHDGLAYLNAKRDEWGPISGERMVRERFTVRGRDRRVSRACVRVGRQRGDSPLLIHLEDSSGRAIVSRRVESARRIPFHRAGANDDNGDWVCTRLGRTRTLQRGRVYALRLSTSSDTQYSMTPLLARDFTTDGAGFHMRSFHFSSGQGQRSSNGGRSWVPLYSSYPQNIQFYFR